MLNDFIYLSYENIDSLENYLLNCEEINLTEWLKFGNKIAISDFTTDLERSKLILSRFKRLVRMVILNLEWFKARNREYSKRKYRERLLQEFYENENQFRLLDGKMLQLIFNKVK